MKKVRILQIQNNDYDSTTSVGKAISENLDKACYEILTVSLSGKLSKPKDKNTNELISLNLPDWAIKGIGRYWAIRKILSLCKTRNIDIVIGHRFKPIHIGLEISRILKLPMIGVIHAFGEYKRKYRREIIAKRSSTLTRFVSVSDPVMDYLIKLECGFNIQNTRTINNSIDFDIVSSQILNRSNARKQLYLNDQDIVVGTIGRLVPVKGHIQLVKAANLLKEKFPSLKIIIVGEGRERANLESEIDRLNLTSNVILVGKIDQAYRLLKAFDVFILPSQSEGFPLAILEAMSAKLPIIGSSIPAIKGIIGELGEIYEAGDIYSLAKSIEKFVVMDCNKRAEIGHRLYEYGISNFNIKKFSADYDMLISSLVTNQCPSANHNSTAQPSIK